jgi:hypothetical protein
LYVLWVLDNFYTNSQPALVSTTGEYFISTLVGKHVIYHAVGVAVSELNWEGFEGVAFRDIMFYSFLELFAREASTT